jgi:hypothetical protein
VCELLLQCGRLTLEEKTKGPFLAGTNVCEQKGGQQVSSREKKVRENWLRQRKAGLGLAPIKRLLRFA